MVPRILYELVWNRHFPLWGWYNIWKWTISRRLDKFRALREARRRDCQLGVVGATLVVAVCQCEGATRVREVIYLSAEAVRRAHVEVPSMQCGNRSSKKSSSEASRALSPARESKAYWLERDGSSRKQMSRMGYIEVRIRRDNEDMYH